jgi:hypothetical protein
MQRVKELFAQYGGVPRICLDFLRNPDNLANYETNSAIARWDVEAQTLWDHVSNAAQLSFTEFSHTIFMLKRMDFNDLRAVTVVPATPSVETWLKSKIRALQHAEKIQLYHRFAGVKASMQIAGLVFGSLAQSILQHRVAIEIVPMQKRSLGSTIRWVSTHEDPDWADQRSMTVDFSPREIVDEYDGATIRQPQQGIEGIFFIPKQAAFDSFVVFDGILYIFQFSIAAEHDIEQGLASFSRQGLDWLPPKTKWYLIFVIPSGKRITCPQPHDHELVDFLTEKDVGLFYAQLKLDKDPSRDDNTDNKESVTAKGDKRKRKAMDDSEMAEAEGTKQKVCHLFLPVSCSPDLYVVEVRLFGPGSARQTGS